MRIRKIFSIPFIVIFVTFLLYSSSLVMNTFADSTNVNNCKSKQNGLNNNNNCNQQNQNQGQDQTQNNNQNVNITLPQPAVAQVIAVAPATQLPKTGEPTLILTFLIILMPFGVFLRKFAKKIKKGGE